MIHPFINTSNVDKNDIEIISCWELVLSKMPFNTRTKSTGAFSVFPSFRPSVFLSFILSAFRSFSNIILEPTDIHQLLIRSSMVPFIILSFIQSIQSYFYLIFSSILSSLLHSNIVISTLFYFILLQHFILHSYSVSQKIYHFTLKSYNYKFQYFRLARNARNFGASYLRLEDYYCYAASALDAVAEIADLSALIPFDAKVIYP